MEKWLLSNLHFVHSLHIGTSCVWCRCEMPWFRHLLWSFQGFGSSFDNKMLVWRMHDYWKFVPLFCCCCIMSACILVTFLWPGERFQVLSFSSSKKAQTFFQFSIWGCFFLFGKEYCHYPPKIQGLFVNSMLSWTPYTSGFIFPILSQISWFLWWILDYYLYNWHRNPKQGIIVINSIQI